MKEPCSKMSSFKTSYTYEVSEGYNSFVAEKTNCLLAFEKIICLLSFAYLFPPLPTSLPFSGNCDESREK